MKLPSLKVLIECYVKNKVLISKKALSICIFSPDFKRTQNTYFFFLLDGSS